MCEENTRACPQNDAGTVVWSMGTGGVGACVGPAGAPSGVVRVDSPSAIPTAMAAAKGMVGLESVCGEDHRRTGGSRTADPSQQTRHARHARQDRQTRSEGHATWGRREGDGGGVVCGKETTQRHEKDLHAVRTGGARRTTASGAFAKPGLVAGRGIGQCAACENPARHRHHGVVRVLETPSKRDTHWWAALVCEKGQ